MTILACLDFESTGVNPGQDRIVEIGLILVELESGVERLAYKKLVNPGMHIPSGAVEIHGINDSDVAKAPSFAELAPGLMRALSVASLVIGHNIERFDVPLLISELVRAKVPVTSFPPIFDTMLMGRGATDDGKVPTLGELCYALDVGYDPELAHDALYDVRVNIHAFIRGWRLGYFQAPTLASASVKEAA